MARLRTFEEALDYIMDVLQQFISGNTIFIALNDEQQNTVLRAFNRKEVLVKAGETLLFTETYCSLVLKERSAPFFIPDTAQDPVTSQMKITTMIGPCSFIGVPISVSHNETFGTICVMDRERMQFSSKEVKLLEAMASLLSYVVDLENATLRDGLTGLYNQNYLKQLDEIWMAEEAQRQEQLISFLFIDIDDFKNINDTYGHEIGDAVLQEFSKRLNQLLRKTDTIIRVGGDEFVVIIECTQDVSEIRSVAEKIIRGMKEPMLIDGFAITLSVSIGISRGNAGDTSVRELIKKADKAMYEVKDQGKSNYKITI